MYAQIILAKVNAYTDRFYTYSIPEELSSSAKVGMQVLVEFGKKKAVGYIVKISDIADESIGKIKPIVEIRGEVPFFSPETVEIAEWMAFYYCAGFSQSLKTMLMPGIESFERPGGKKRFNPIKVKISGSQMDVRANDINKDYIKEAKKVLISGKSVIILFPEIDQNSDLILECKKIFGDTMAVLHSSMTVKDRAKEWERIYREEAKTVIGTRNALFAPVKDLGLIIIVQEEEFTYKSEQNPKYHARETAKFICDKNKTPLLLVSSCPTVETFYNSDKGKYSLIKLENKESIKFPTIEIIDMKRDEKAGNTISRKLIDEIRTAMQNGKRTAVLINRRGYSPFVMCAGCGNTMECPNCSISLAYHTEDKSLHCIKCGFKQTVRSVCPKCLSSNLRFIGSGTQKIESDISRFFPKTKIFRLDSDLAKTRGAVEKVIEGFGKEKDSILIGTRMIEKALDRFEVGLVAIASADSLLNSPDFRAAEETFKMIHDICGFSNNIKTPGKVLIQTYNPEHYAIAYAKNNDYNGFYKREIEQRSAQKYPPFGNLINIFLYGADDICVRNVAEEILKGLEPLPQNIIVLGPQQAGISRVRGSVKWQILIKGPNLDIIKRKLKESAGQAIIIGKKNFGRRIRISIDVDPITVI